MCDHHHAARHILCPQCDLLVALPQLEHRQKAACPRCGTSPATEATLMRKPPLLRLFRIASAPYFMPAKTPSLFRAKIFS